MDKDGNGTISISEFLNMSVNLMRSDSDTRDNSIPYSHNDRLNLTLYLKLRALVLKSDLVLDPKLKLEIHII